MAKGPRYSAGYYSNVSTAIGHLEILCARLDQRAPPERVMFQLRRAQKNLSRVEQWLEKRMNAGEEDV